MPIDASQLKVDLEVQERWRRRLNVTVPAEIVAEERRKAARKLASRLKLPGFRKGKIPERVVEQRYGQALRQETLDRLINDAYREALELESLRPISEGEVEDVAYEPEEDLTFAISFDVQPEIELTRLGDFTVERPATAVGDAEVEKVLERLREQNSVWNPREDGSPGDEDLVQVEIEQLDEDEEEDGPREYEFVLGREQALPDIEEAIRSMEVGEAKETTVTFPEDFPNEERRGESRRLRIKLVGRKIRELPEVDDVFASSLGEFEDVAALKAAVREDLQREASRESEQELRGRLLDQLLAANPFEVPASLVDGYLDQAIGDDPNIPEDEMAEAKASLRPQAERGVKRALVVERVAETQGLRATEDEVDARVEEIAESADTSPAQMYARLQKAGRLSRIEREITEEKVFDFLKTKSEIRDASGS